MTCSVCKGSGLMTVTTSDPSSQAMQQANRPCIMGCKKPSSGVSGNAPLEGREFRVKTRAKHKDPDNDYGAPGERIDFFKLHGIKRDDDAV